MRVEILQSTLLEGMLCSLRLKGWPAPTEYLWGARLNAREAVCECLDVLLSCSEEPAVTLKRMCACVRVCVWAKAPTHPLLLSLTHSMQWHHCLFLWMLACTCTHQGVFYYSYAKSFLSYFVSCSCSLVQKLFYVARVWNAVRNFLFQHLLFVSVYSMITLIGQRKTGEWLSTAD